MNEIDWIIQCIFWFWRSCFPLVTLLCNQSTDLRLGELWPCYVLYLGNVGISVGPQPVLSRMLLMGQKIIKNLVDNMFLSDLPKFSGRFGTQMPYRRPDFPNLGDSLEHKCLQCRQDFLWNFMRVIGLCEIWSLARRMLSVGLQSELIHIQDFHSHFVRVIALWKSLCLSRHTFSIGIQQDVFSTHLEHTYLQSDTRWICSVKFYELLPFETLQAFLYIHLPHSDALKCLCYTPKATKM